jgi:outer membrane protein
MDTKLYRPLLAAFVLALAGPIVQAQAPAPAAAAPAGQGQELRIGVVDIQRVLRDSQPARAAQAKLEAEFSRRERELTEMAARLRTASERLEREAPTLSETDRNRRQRELVEQDREFQRLRRAFQEDLAQRRNEELAQVLERANRVVRQIFEQERYDLILQEVVFAGPRVDITRRVIDALNAGR